MQVLDWHTVHTHLLCQCPTNAKHFKLYVYLLAHTIKQDIGTGISHDCHWLNKGSHAWIDSTKSAHAVKGLYDTYTQQGTLKSSMTLL
jgi:hypothetical protein